MINPNLLNSVNQYFARHKSQSFVVNPSIPILYFGNEEAYRASDLKVITVGKNPSLNEFLDKGLGKYNVLYRFPNFNGKNYTSVWNEYFQKRPLIQWFSAFEPILNGMGCSYYQNNQFKNIVLHTDICSPIATDPTWSRLSNNQQQLLFTQGLQIWWDLVKDLAPDVILISIPKNLFMQNISTVFGQSIFTASHRANGKRRIRSYEVFRQYLNINNKLTNIVYGKANIKPFMDIDDNLKRKLGSQII
jgi:hypothetical protein